MPDENKTMGYKMFYNPETKKYEYETEPTPVHYENGVTWFNLLSSAENTTRAYNNDLECGRRAVYICSDCGTVVEMNEKEIEWYKDRVLDLPKRCFDCRQKRKSRKNNI